MTYYNATSNGIDVPIHPGRVLFVELAEEAEPAHEMVQGYITGGCTRVVRAIGVDEEWGLPALQKLATGKNRKVERVIGGKNSKGVSCTCLAVVSSIY